MADTVRRVEYCYVTVPDRPGEGRKVLSALKDGGVNLLAYLGFPSGSGQSQMDLIAEKTDGLQRAAEKAGIKLSETKRAFLVQGNDRAGAVADTLARLADANVNVTAAAASSAGSNYSMVVWVAPGDYDKASKALGAS